MKANRNLSLQSSRSSKNKKQVNHSYNPPLFFVVGDSFTYYNELPFFIRLKKKVPFVQVYGRLLRSSMAA